MSTAHSTVLLTGATGFVGRNILTELLRQDYHVRCLVRPGGRSRLPSDQRIVPVVGDVRQAEDCLRAAEGASAAIHLVGIIREVGSQTFEGLHVEGTRNVVAACIAAGVRRLIHMSAHGASPTSGAVYQRTKAAAEKIVTESSLRWTIFRPALILGAGGEFLEQMVGLVSPRWRPVPVLGDGNNVVQPLGVEEVADLFVRALTSDQAAGKIYCLGGPRAMTFNEFLDTLSGVVCRRRRAKVHIPFLVVRPLVGLLDRLLSRAPVTREQLVMLREAQPVDISEAAKDFSWHPAPLEDVLTRALAKEEANAPGR